MGGYVATADVEVAGRGAFAPVVKPLLAMTAPTPAAAAAAAAAMKHNTTTARAATATTTTTTSLLRRWLKGLSLGGDVDFLKLGGTLRHHSSVGSPYCGAPAAATLALRAEAGLLVPLTRPRSFLVDRFHLGGASDLPGFAGRGVGPRSAAPPTAPATPEAPPAATATATATAPPPQQQPQPQQQCGVVGGEPLGGDARLVVGAALSAPPPLELLRVAGMAARGVPAGRGPVGVSAIPLGKRQQRERCW